MGVRPQVNASRAAPACKRGLQELLRRCKSAKSDWLCRMPTPHSDPNQVCGVSGYKVVSAQLVCAESFRLVENTRVQSSGFE